MKRKLLIGTVTGVVVSIGVVACGSGRGVSGESSNSSGPTCSTLSGSTLIGANVVQKSVQTPGHLRQLRSHLFTRKKDARDAGKFDETQQLPITVSLSLNHAANLENELIAIYSKNNPKFHKFLTPSDFKARYAPTDDQVNQVKAYLSAQGMTSVVADSGGVLIHAVGSVGKLNAAFHTEMHRFTDSHGVNFRAPMQELQIPTELPIQGVHGLQNLTLAHGHLREPEASAKSASGPNGGFSPGDIRTAYQITSKMDGGGQTLALFELDGYNTSDIAAYEGQFGLSGVPLENILVDSVTGAAGSGAAEVTLDIELMQAIAPRAAKILVYEGPNSDQGILDTYSQIAQDNVAKSISTSWGEAEDAITASFVEAEYNIFMQMAAQGQSIYAASGDAGANDDGTSLSVDDPSSQPYMVAVGGTSLTTDESGVRVSESTWSDAKGGGGGGISALWTVPVWQQGLVGSASNKSSSSMRNSPDVALNADPTTGYAIYFDGSWGAYGGTSCAAPIWAAFNALVNQEREASGLAPIGFIVPYLYNIGRSGRYSSDFFDISDGSTNGFYPAVQGYDDATGWGTLNASGLIQDLGTDASGSDVGGGALPAGACVLAT